jgi:hypothetical protein
MCFRLLGAIRSADGGTPTALDALAFECGLDVRQATRNGTEFLEIAWGDCACSLVTRREGRERAIRFVEALFARGCRVQLLLVSDDGDGWQAGAPVSLARQAFRDHALAALPEGRVAELR